MTRTEKRLADKAQRTSRPHVGAAPRAVLLSQEHMAQLHRHAQHTYPEECCGVLLGQSGTAVSVSSVHPTGNQHGTRLAERYKVDPREILRLDHTAEESGTEIVGFYHSHPDHPAKPSRTDAQYAWPGYVYIILATAAQVGVKEARAWAYDEHLRRFQEYPIRVIGGVT